MGESWNRERYEAGRAQARARLEALDRELTVELGEFSLCFQTEERLRLELEEIAYREGLEDPEVFDDEWAVWREGASDGAWLRCRVQSQDGPDSPSLEGLELEDPSGQRHVLAVDEEAPVAGAQELAARSPRCAVVAVWWDGTRVPFSFS